MKVLVSDTSVLIDLERGALLGTSFALPFEFAVPDLLYRQELAEHGGPALLKLGLRIEDLDGDGVSLALRYRQARPLPILARQFRPRPRPTPFLNTLVR